MAGRYIAEEPEREFIGVDVGTVIEAAVRRVSGCPLGEVDL